MPGSTPLRAGADRLGLIDFGDLTYSWTIAELAIACAYLLMDKADLPAALRGPVRGYHRKLPLFRTGDGAFSMT